jgi:hypothetical protein
VNDENQIKMKKSIFHIISTILITTILNLLFFVNMTLSNTSDSTHVLKNKILIDNYGKRYIDALFITEELNINGFLNESVWDKISFQSNFIQREPNEGSKSTERTEVGILYDKNNIYFGVKCYDSQSDKIVAREMRRDVIVDNDDFFEMILDTYHDHRTGFYFIFNAHGSKRDAALANESRNFNDAWDGIWECKTQITSEGWFAELAIPWKTLRFSEQDSTVWGINFARMIRRKNEHVHWHLVSREFGRSGILKLSEAGSLIGLFNLHIGTNFELKPYFLGGLENDENTEFKNENLKDIGLDAKIALAANMTLDLSVNTDFAQVEADQEQVNLDRFELYYPEKREFFLEGDEILTFGERRFRYRLPDFSLFYSRRIGLVDGHEARILGGSKIVGKLSQYQIIAMNLLTDDVTFKEDSIETKTNSTNFSVFRIRRDIFNRSNIGLMFLNKELQNSTNYNRSVGFDINMPLTRFFTATGYIAGTFASNEKEDSVFINMNTKNLIGKLNLVYDSDLWDFSASYEDVGARFNPEMGFIRRTDYQLSNISFGYSPRPENSPCIRQFSYNISGKYRNNHNNKMLDNNLDASMEIKFQNSAEIKISSQRKTDYLNYDWEVRPGLLIPAGTYSGYNYYIEGKSDVSRPISVEVDLSYGDYYTGNRFSSSLGAIITSIPRLRMEMQYNYNHVDLPQKRFLTNTLGIRAFYFFSTELYFKTYVQWNDDKLKFGGKEKIISNFLIRWIYSPGSDIYLLYNDGRMLGPGMDEINNRTLMFKIIYLWRK